MADRAVSDDDIFLKIQNEMAVGPSPDNPQTYIAMWRGVRIASGAHPSLVTEEALDRAELLWNLMEKGILTRGAAW